MRKRVFKIFFFLLLMMPLCVNAADFLLCGNGRKIPFVLAWGISVVYIIIRIVVPILFVITGMISFFKATLSSKTEDELQKAKKSLVSKIIAAIMIFFIASIINLVISLAVGRDNSFSSCLSCMVNPNNCVEDDSSIVKLCPGLLSEQSDYDNNCVYQGSKNGKLIYSNTGNTGINNVPKQNTNNNTPNNATNNTSNTPSNYKKPDKVDVKKTDGATYMNGILIVNKSYSIPESYRPSNSTGKDYCNDCLTDETLSAFNEMKSAAASEGLTLKVVSGFRSYDFQQRLYDNYVARDGKDGADKYSARPGHSEHQTGLAFDINMAGDAFTNTPEGKWVNENCYKYGFIIRYPDGKMNYTGFKYESWHLRYVGKELAEVLYNNGNWVSLEEYFDITSEYKK